MFLVNSRLGLFSAALSPELPFSRSYGVILPSSLTRVLPLALGFSPRPPASVYGTGTFADLAAFPASVNLSTSLLFFVPHHTSCSARRTSLPDTLCACPGSTINRVGRSFCVPASSFATVVLESQPAVHRLRLYVLTLGPDLPRVDEPSPGNLGLTAAMFLT